MKSQKPDNSADLFHSQLSQTLNLSHPLVRLSEKMSWEKFEVDIDVIYNEGTGQPPLPTRLLADLDYLKCTFNESVVKPWFEKPYWQYFCGFKYLQYELPLHPSSLVRWRNRVGSKLDSPLKQTILARANHLLAPQQQDKNKLYSMHTAEEECIAEGKRTSVTRLAIRPHS